MLHLSLTFFFAHLQMRIVTILPLSYLNLTLLFALWQSYLNLISLLLSSLHPSNYKFWQSYLNLISVLLSLLLIFKCLFLQSYLNLISILLSSLLIFEWVLWKSQSYISLSLLFAHLQLYFVIILPQLSQSYFTLCSSATAFCESNLACNENCSACVRSPSLPNDSARARLRD